MGLIDHHNAHWIGEASKERVAAVDGRVAYMNRLPLHATEFLKISTPPTQPRRRDLTPELAYIDGVSMIASITST